MLARLGVRGTCLAIGLLAVLGPAAAAQDQENPIVAAVKPRLKNPDKPFTLVVRVQVKEGAADRLEAAFAKATRATRQEKGNLAYDLNQDPQEPSHYLLYERWKSLADLEAHLGTPYIKALLTELHEVTVGSPDLQVLVPVGD